MTNKPPKSPNDHFDELYRSGVGMMIFNAQGMVFVGERIDSAGSWQMPQGGIDAGEELEVAVFREMAEEIGTGNAVILQIMEDWIFYDIPHYKASKIWDGKYIGQKQKWIALRFLGQDSDINLTAHSHPEFSKWKWVKLDELLRNVVPFKRDAYALVLKTFAHYAEIELEK
jgi:putative (di)nucleoside polyphosphate hydrolase